MNISLESLRNDQRSVEMKIEALHIQIKQSEKEKKRIEKTISSLLSKNKMTGTVPDSYSKDLPWKQKISYALNILSKATIDEITTAIQKREPKLKRDKVYTTVQRTVIRMVNEATVVKTGKYNSIYALNK
jgi:hypothetical protein